MANAGGDLEVPMAHQPSDDMHLNMLPLFESGDFYDCTIKVKADTDTQYKVDIFGFGVREDEI